MNSDSLPIMFHPYRPCQREEEHIGRNYILHQSFARLSTDDIQSFVIIGLAKSGKTSLINQICNTNIVEKHIKPKEKAKKYRFLLFDCKEHINNINSENDFFKLFYKKIEMLLGICSLNGITDLDKITQWLFKYDLRLVVVLDNFNLIITNPNFNVVFYDGLRSWFSTKVNIACIITSPVHLLKLSVPTELSGSPFFNIFDAFTLKPVELTEATKLLNDRFPKVLNGCEIEISKIIKYTGFNPYNLQVAGYLWLKHYNKTGEKQFEKALPEIKKKLIPYYNDIYSNLTEKQMAGIRKILSHDYNNELVTIDHSLIANGWVTKDKKHIVAKLMKDYFCEKLKINYYKDKYIIRKIGLFFKKLFYINK